MLLFRYLNQIISDKIIWIVDIRIKYSPLKYSNKNFNKADKVLNVFFVCASCYEHYTLWLRSIEQLK